MNLDDFIITCFCWIDEMLPVVTQGQRLRQAGPMPTLSDSEVLTIEVVGSYLGLSQDSAIFDYFRRHSSHFFPVLARLHRRLWCWLRDEAVRHDPLVGIVDSMPVPVCRFARPPGVLGFVAS